MLDDSLVDFRYWPREYNHFECYHWSDGLNAVYVFNAGDSEIWYDYKRGYSIACRPGEVIRIDASRSGAEGLISPDTVDGECALTAGHLCRPPGNVSTAAGQRKLQKKEEGRITIFSLPLRISSSDLALLRRMHVTAPVSSVKRPLKWHKSSVIEKLY